MELCLGSHVSPIGEFMICAADAPDDPEHVDIAELAPDPTRVTHLRTKNPDLMIAVAAPTPETARTCVAAGADLLIGDHLAAVCAATGTALLCSDPEKATAAGVRPNKLIVEAPPGTPAAHLERLVQAGHAILVTPATAPQDPATIDLAAISVYAWLGARIFRVPAQAAPATREALDMIASIKGHRPPKVSRRGLV
jgi:dihydropteroate synthase